MDTRSLVKTYIKAYKLKLGRPKKLPFAEIADFRRVILQAWAEYSPDAPYEADFMKGFGCHPNALTAGYLERRKEGVEIVLYGNAADDRTVWVIYSLPHDGEPTLSNRVEILPGEPEYTPHSRRSI